jgi:hypothetical protein
MVLSDENMKVIQDTTDPKTLAKEILEQGPPYNEKEIKILVKAAGKLTDTLNDLDFERDGHRWGDSIMAKYAKHIQNFPYTYKEEAKGVDPSIDTKQQHIGPMAQDIEQVNPACVTETPEGVKTVDTARLALMNSGVIADLAREIQELKNGKN